MSDFRWRAKVAVDVGMPVGVVLRQGLTGGLRGFAARHGLAAADVSHCINGRWRYPHIRRLLVTELDLDATWLDAELDRLSTPSAVASPNAA